MRKDLRHKALFVELYERARTGTLLTRQETDGEIQRLALKIGRELPRLGHAVFGWSGGKDSVVLAFLLGWAGFELPGVCAITRLEYPVVDDWIRRHKPANVELIETKHDVAWLRANRRFLFPADQRTTSEWYKIVQQAEQDAFMVRERATVLVTGRRRLDGNMVPSEVYTTGDGRTRYAPLADVGHDVIWSILFWHRLPEYPLYALSDIAKVTGTGAWPQARGWDSVAAIDPDLAARMRPEFPA